MIESRSKNWVTSPFCFLLFVALLAGCAPVIKTGNGVAPGASFSHRVTFQFLPDPSISGISQGNTNTYYRDLVGRDVLASLNAQGYRYFTNRKTDLLIAYHFFLNQDEAIKDWNGYSGYKFAAVPGAHADFDRSKPTAPARGVLVIDVIDPKQRKLIWRGWATTKVNSHNKTAQEKLIKAAVNQVLAGLPKRE